MTDWQPARRSNGIMVGALVGCVIVILGLGGTLTFVVLHKSGPSPSAPTPVAALTTTAPPPVTAVMGSCVENYDGRYAADVVVTNTTSQVQGYTVQVAFDSQDGANQLDTGTGTQASVQPHEQADIVAYGHLQVGTYTMPGGITQPQRYRCRLTGATQN